MTQLSTHSRKIFVLLAVLSLAFAVSVFQVSAESIGTTSAISLDGHCEIPDSGPWPPCATGGATGGDSGDCVIPASGPWPPCATGGGSGGGGAASAPGQACPASGKWPAGCVPGGGGGAAPAPGGSGDCVIPASGPWPPCATGGGGGGTAPAPAPAPAPTPGESAPPPPPAPPANPGNTDILLNEGQFLTGLTVNGGGTHTMDVTVHYRTSDPETFIPWFLVVDPINCFDWCAELVSGEQFFPIKGDWLLPPSEYPMAASGGVNIEVAMDNLYCDFSPRSEVLQVAVFNAFDFFINDGPLTLDGVMFVEVQKEWCK